MISYTIQQSVQIIVELFFETAIGEAVTVNGYQMMKL